MIELRKAGLPIGIEDGESRHGIQVANLKANISKTCVSSGRSADRTRLNSPEHAFMPTRLYAAFSDRSKIKRNALFKIIACTFRKETTGKSFYSLSSSI